MTDADREYIEKLLDMSEQIGYKCIDDCDKCFQRRLCEAVTGMETYVAEKLKKEKRAVETA